MFRRPNFCCSCGEKIDRIEWHLWTSRRYCDLCETENRLDEWLPRTLGIFILSIGLFGAGSMIRGTRDTPDLQHSPVEMARRRAASLAEIPGRAEITVSAESAPSTPLQRASSERNRGGGDLAADSAYDKPQDKYYYCGAETKKGTACTRKVKGGRRCWQHTGREAMLPDSELEIKVEDEEQAGRTGRPRSR